MLRNDAQEKIGKIAKYIPVNFELNIYPLLGTIQRPVEQSSRFVNEIEPSSEGTLIPLIEDVTREKVGTPQYS